MLHMIRSYFGFLCVKKLIAYDHYTFMPISVDYPFGNCSTTTSYTKASGGSQCL